MDYHVFYGGIGASCAIIGVTSGLVWCIITLITRPIKSDIQDIKLILKEIVPKTKSEQELERIITVEMNRHTFECTKSTSDKISHEIKQHEERYHR